MIYVTSDWHLGHKNIIKYCKRPFADCQEMEEELIKRYQATVNADDTVVFVGDVFWREKLPDMRAVLEQLPGEKHLVRGNHDKGTTAKYKKAGFEGVHDNFLILTSPLDTSDYHYVYHDPSYSQMMRTKKFLCGHVHDLFLKEKNVINVGVDVWDYYPVAFAEIEVIFSRYGLTKSLPKP